MSGLGVWGEGLEIRTFCMRAGIAEDSCSTGDNSVQPPNLSGM